MSQHISSRTIHTIHIDLQDDVLGKIEQGDEVEVILSSRLGMSTAKRLTWRDLESLTKDEGVYRTSARRKVSTL